MQTSQVVDYIENVLNHLPQDWIKLTTHRLDIYNEELAKTEFLEEFEKLYQKNEFSQSALKNLPTAYDYIRLGHPLSSILEWAIAKENNLEPEQVIGFSSQTMAILAVLRKNHFDHKKTQLLYTTHLPEAFDEAIVKEVYGYDFDLKHIDDKDAILNFDGSTVFITQNSDIGQLKWQNNIDFYISIHEDFGSIIHINDKNAEYVPDIQHVRRRETVAITPGDSLKALQTFVGKTEKTSKQDSAEENKVKVLENIRNITDTKAKPLLGSCGLSVQYAIMMGLIHEAQTKHPYKAIKIIVPPNCYGGTNDQARRVAACLNNVDIMDLPVDGDNDMVQSTDLVLNQVAEMDAVPLIIAEIPTNPRVEVPDLEKLKTALIQPRKNPKCDEAIAPIFILDQTFCPNYNFLGENQILSSVETISYVSGSKFPSGGKCTAGYLVANKKAEYLLDKIETNLKLCDNEATDFQISILSEQLPSMKQRIADAYKNTRTFVEFIKETLPSAKINFVSKTLAEQGFTPSVFSLDLPTKGETLEERETYKRALNQKLIDMMITQIPNESKYCVSYGQLKGCYWTIPATSTQGTTKEEDKDYIARVSVSPDLDLDKHKSVFAEFVEKEIH
ncbi:PLP-dependent transferase [Flavobacteriaceae bacterium 14752]|uniref:PLP-dependent transferase n=1 Tax=Mesohalobacter salilacus TaxID=2491711 RepID=UPI000F63ADF0|nr:cystathionine beta-synthase [Flavobacteriaceae bacterium 14752]